MTATQSKYALKGYNAACLKCDDRYFNEKNPVGYVSLEVCGKCRVEPVREKRSWKKKPRNDGTDFDFRRYLR